MMEILHKSRYGESCDCRLLGTNAANTDVRFVKCYLPNSFKCEWLDRGQPYQRIYGEPVLFTVRTDDPEEWLLAAFRFGAENVVAYPDNGWVLFGPYPSPEAAEAAVERLRYQAEVIDPEQLSDLLDDCAGCHTDG